MKTRQRVLMLGGVVVLAGVIGVLGASPARSELPSPEKGSLPGFPENQILAEALATELGQASPVATAAGANREIKDLPPGSGGRTIPASASTTAATTGRSTAAVPGATPAPRRRRSGRRSCSTDTPPTPAATRPRRSTTSATPT